VVPQSNDLDHRQAARAVIGLRAAYLRYMSDRGEIPDQEIADTAIVEFVGWAAALNEQLEKTDTTYAGRRDADDDGRVIRALLFVCDRHQHQMAITSLKVRRIGPSDLDPTQELTTTRIVWQELAEFPESADDTATTAEYRARRAAYEEQLEGRGYPLLSLLSALNFLTREVSSRGIELPLH
jgi:hypothetical protein